MARKVDQDRLDQLREAIIAYPQQKPGWFASLLGRDNKSVMRELPLLEARGELLMEDENGRISWFGRRQ